MELLTRTWYKICLKDNMKILGLIVSTGAMSLWGFFQYIQGGGQGNYALSPYANYMSWDDESKPSSSYLDTVFDSTRNRIIPFSVKAMEFKDISPKGLVIFSHGYSNNRPDAYLSYDYIGQSLKSRGYVVLSIQHEQAGDPVLPTKGDLQVLRKPFWENGARNIELVLKNFLEANRAYADLPLILIGHSNGGDQSAYYAMQHPGEVSALISLDNWRHSLSTIEVGRGLTIRANDSRTDEMVFKNWEQRKTQYFQIDSVNVKHADMNDKGTMEQKKEILRSIFVFLNEKLPTED